MSKRNSPEAKRAARERLRAERERQAKRERIRRQLIVAGSVVVILAGAAGIGVAIANRDTGGGDNTDWGAVRDQIEAAAEGEEPSGENAFPTDAPANTSGDDGLTVRIGDENAEHTLTLFEDPRCPACASFEQSVGAEVRQGMEDGTYAVEFVFGTFLDDRLTGSGSKNALNALGAALNVSPEAFLDLHDALYSAEHHPAETDDAFADDQELLEIAQSIPSLENNQEFEDAVLNSTYAVWALQMSDKFNSSPEVEGTPTLKWDGTVIETPQTPDQFNQMVEQFTAEDAGSEDGGEGAAEEDTTDQGTDESPAAESSEESADANQ